MTGTDRDQGGAVVGGGLARSRVKTISQMSKSWWTKPRITVTSFLRSTPVGVVKPPITKSVEAECCFEEKTFFKWLNNSAFFFSS